MTKEVKIGLIGIAALAMLIFGINYLKGINMFQSANYYYVEYTNINGLAGSSPVFANGYKVGTVRNINYNYAKPGHVTVEWSYTGYNRSAFSCRSHGQPY